MAWGKTHGEMTVVVDGALCIVIIIDVFQSMMSSMMVVDLKLLINKLYATLSITIFIDVIKTMMASIIAVDIINDGGGQ